MELRVHAPEVVGPGDVGAFDFRVTHRQWVAIGPNSTEARGSGFGFAEQLQVDLDRVDLLHAADVRPADFLECIEEGARSLEASGGVHDLVAVDPAAAALDLVLRPERKLPLGTSDLA